MIKRLEWLIYGEGPWELGLFLPWEGGSEADSCQCMQNAEGKVQRRGNQALVSGAWWQGKRQRAETERASSECQDFYFYFFVQWGWLSTGMSCQGGCGVSICGDIQELSCHSPGKLALGGLVWAWELDRVTCRGFWDSPQHSIPWRTAGPCCFWPVDN